jgi:hypothetical protein
MKTNPNEVFASSPALNLLERAQHAFTLLPVENRQEFQNTPAARRAFTIGFVTGARLAAVAPP